MFVASAAVPPNCCASTAMLSQTRFLSRHCPPMIDAKHWTIVVESHCKSWRWPLDSSKHQSWTEQWRFYRRFETLDPLHSKCRDWHVVHLERWFKHNVRGSSWRCNRQSNRWIRRGLIRGPSGLVGWWVVLMTDQLVCSFRFLNILPHNGLFWLIQSSFDIVCLHLQCSELILNN